MFYTSHIVGHVLNNTLCMTNYAYHGWHNTLYMIHLYDTLCMMFLHDVLCIIFSNMMFFVGHLVYDTLCILNRVFFYTY